MKNKKKLNLKQRILLDNRLYPNSRQAVTNKFHNQSRNSWHTFQSLHQPPSHFHSTLPSFHHPNNSLILSTTDSDIDSLIRKSKAKNPQNIHLHRKYWKFNRKPFHKLVKFVNERNIGKLMEVYEGMDRVKGLSYRYRKYVNRSVN